MKVAVKGKLLPLRRVEGLPAEMSDEALLAACATGETAALGAKARGVLELGIRPMHMEVHGSPVDGGVPVMIKTVEDQGSFKILTASLNGHALRARVPEGHPIPENQAWLTFPPQRTKLFADKRLVR